MSYRLQRIAAIFAWTLGGFVGWPMALVFALRLLVYCQGVFGWRPLSHWLPEWADDLFIYGFFGLGTAVITAAALILGIRGKLPGTHRIAAPGQGQGFPIETIENEG